QTTRPLDVGSDEWRRIQDRAIHVRLSGKVDDCIEPVLFEQRVDLSSIGDITPEKCITRMFRNSADVPEISGIRQKVVIHDLYIRLFVQNVSDETGTDESGSACNKNFHSLPRLRFVQLSEF